MGSTSGGGSAPAGQQTAPLSVVLALAGMELAFLSLLTDDELVIRRSALSPGAPVWPELSTGSRHARLTSLCHRLVEGAPATTSDVAGHPVYGSSTLAASAGIVSYVGIPIQTSAGLVGTLCGVDRSSVAVGDRTVDALADLAPLFAAELAPSPQLWLARAGDGWRVNGLPDSPSGAHDAEDLTSAMVLADLLAADLATPSTRPARGPEDADELQRLRVSVSQLEHALAARVVVEQAIGVLAERRRTSPRSAFELLRSTARGAGRRVHTLAAEVVSSTTGAGANLNAALGRATIPSPAAIAGAVRPVPRPPVPSRPEAGPVATQPQPATRR